MRACVRVCVYVRLACVRIHSHLVENTAIQLVHAKQNGQERLSSVNGSCALHQQRQKHKQHRKQRNAQV